jgi:hypothetical protein
VHGLSRSRRDPREDVLRGFAWVRVYFDHIPGNTLATLTLIIFGFADPAELFVILAGLSSIMAYGQRFARCGIRNFAVSLLGASQRLNLYRAGCSLS